MTKVVCDDCGWRGEDDAVLTGPNPFHPDMAIIGCPQCKEIGTIVRACDEPECWKQVSCGTPTADGYRCTCGAHRPRTEEAA
jgi:hypothetical protein